jgi:SNF2 family DNA or RNA helicase
MQREDFIGIFREMKGLPVTIRYLDPPLHEFLPHTDDEIKELAKTLDMTFDALKARIESLKEFNPMMGHRGCRLAVTYLWNIVCLDEAHTIKNKDTKMAQAAFGLQAHTRIALTGTPIQNHLGEVWSLFNFINPGMLGNYEGFQKKFVNQTEAGNKDRQHQLKRMLLPFILRRTKNEVIEELPDKTEVIRTVELSKDEMNTYELIRKRAKKQLEDERKVSVSILAEITKLRQAACATSLVDKTLDFPSSKLAELSELVDDICSDGNRVLVFSQFTSFLELVRKELDSKKLEYLYLDGSTSMKKRNDMVKQFQESDVPIFVISLKAGGLGLNLTGANYVIHCDPWWNPAIEQQATDRAYRIGQENKVTVYHLVSDHTIEQKIMRLHETKRNIADSMLDGSNVSHKLTEKELMEMLAG